MTMTDTMTMYETKQFFCIKKKQQNILFFKV